MTYLGLWNCLQIVEIRRAGLRESVLLRQYDLGRDIAYRRRERRYREGRQHRNRRFARENENGAPLVGRLESVPADIPMIEWRSVKPQRSSICELRV